MSDLPSRFRPELELAELPVMKDATAGTVRLEGTLAKRMPPMPGGALDELYLLRCTSTRCL